MNDEKLDKNGLIKVWLKFWTLVKLLVGDVDIAGKGDLQTQINHIDNRVDECFRNASDGKKLLANAITGKGVLTKASDTFATMAENIGNIKEVDDSVNVESLNYRTGYNAGVAATKKGTAGTGDVLTGKTFTNASSVGANGGMANKGAVTVDSGPVTQDDTYTYLAVPAAAFYNTNSKLRTKNSNILPKKVARVDKTTGRLTMTVPAGAKSGILILCASYWNGEKIVFDAPSGDGIVSATKVHGAYISDSGLNTSANVNVVIYTVSLTSNGTITAENNYESNQHGGKSMILLYS